MISFNVWRFLVIGIGLFLGAISYTVYAVDFDSCRDDLNRLRRASSDAADKTAEAKEKEDQFERCKNDPYSYEYKYDRCRSTATYFQSSISDLKSELDTVDSRIRSARSSCGYNLTGINGALAPAQKDKGTGDNHCDMIRSYRGKLPYETLVKTCSGSMPEEECKKCLAFKLGGKP